MTHFFTEANGVIHSVQKVGLKSIERFDGEVDAVLIERRSKLLETLNRVLPFVVRATPAGQIAYRRAIGSDERLCPNRCGRFYSLPQECDRTRANGRVTRYQTQVTGKGRAKDSFESCCFNPAAHICCGKCTELEPGNLSSIEPPFTELRKQVE